MISTYSPGASPSSGTTPPPGSRDAKLLAGFEEWVRSQYTRDGQWCCTMSDGRPLDADEIRIVDGGYQVKWSTRHWTAGNDEWIAVDPGSVLHDASPIGMHIAWIMNGRVYCLAVPELF